MSRFFKPEDATGWITSEDMFNPDFQSYDRMLASNQAQINKQALERQAILDALALVDYEDSLDRENMKEWQDYWQGQVDNVASTMQKDLLNYQQNDKMIRDLRNKLGADIKTGVGRNLMKTKENWDNFEKQLEKMPEHLRDTYRNYYLNNFTNSTNGKHSKVGIFEAGEMFNDININEEFLKSHHFNALKPNSEASVVRDTNGKFWIKEGQSVKMLPVEKVLEAYDNFIAENKNRLSTYAKDRATVFGLNNMVDANGNLRTDSGSWLNQQRENIKPYAYHNIETTKDKAYDELYLARAKSEMDLQNQLRVARASGSGSNNNLQIITPTVDIPGAHVTPSAKRIYNAYGENFIKVMQQNGIGEKELKAIENIPRDKDFHNKAMSILNNANFFNEKENLRRWANNNQQEAYDKIVGNYGQFAQSPEVLATVYSRISNAGEEGLKKMLHSATDLTIFDLYNGGNYVDNENEGKQKLADLPNLINNHPEKFGEVVNNAVKDGFKLKNLDKDLTLSNEIAPINSGTKDGFGLFAKAILTLTRNVENVDGSTYEEKMYVPIALQSQQAIMSASVYDIDKNNMSIGKNAQKF